MLSSSDKAEINNKMIILKSKIKSICEYQSNASPWSRFMITIFVGSQTMLNLKKKNQKSKDGSTNTRKESELLALKRLKPSTVFSSLNLALHPQKLTKILTNPQSNEESRSISRILLNPITQKTFVILKENHDLEKLEEFLVSIQTKTNQRLNEKLNKKNRKKASPVESDSETTSAPPEKKKKLAKLKQEPPSLQQDSFFIKPTGEAYHATIESLGDHSSSDEEEKIVKPKKVKKVPAPMKKSLPPAIQQKKEEPSKDEAELIHPSWKAKKELKPQIQTYTGTKIKFD